MDIYNYLKKDHQKVADLMEQVISSQDTDQREKLFLTIRQELTLHADTEEATFYAAIEEATESTPIEEKMEHAEHEHDEIRDYLDKLTDLSASDEAWIETFGEFKHAVSHHVEEEEEDIFEKAKKLLTDAQAKELAVEMDELKQKQLKKMKAA